MHNHCAIGEKIRNAMNHYVRKYNDKFNFKLIIKY